MSGKRLRHGSMRDIIENWRGVELSAGASFWPRPARSLGLLELTSSLAYAASQRDESENKKIAVGVAKRLAVPFLSLKPSEAHILLEEIADATLDDKRKKA